MSATQEFLQSLHEAFAPESETPWLLWLLLILLLVASAILLGRVMSRRNARRRLHAELLRLGAEKRLSRADIGAVLGLGELAQISPLDVMRHLAAFERATARELALLATSPHAVREASARRIAELRAALGFDVLPPDHWLSTTRELKPGDVLQSGAGHFQVVVVTESSFTVALAVPQATVVGSGRLALEVVRPHDARYAVNCRILESFEIASRENDPGEHHRVVLAHDEDPQRLQQREFVRVRVDRPVTFSGVDRRTPGAAPALGHTVDVSAGGMSFHLGESPARGSLHLCAFELGEGVRFNDVSAIVLSSTPEAAGGFHVRIAFTGLSPADRERLAAAVAWHEQHDPARVAIR